MSRPIRDSIAANWSHHHREISPMFLLREALPTDLDQLRGLARTLNTLNLPDDSARLKRLVQISRESFDGTYRKPRFRDYLFVLEDVAEKRLIGSCLIIAQHGTHERPAVYYDVHNEQKYSSTLDKLIIHRVLQLRFDYDGPTEIGGLILAPEYRAHPLKLGRILSFVRFLFIGLHRDLFRDEVVAELLPPLNDDGTSDLWDCLGRNFTGLNYREADLLSRDNVEFIRNLFPSKPIYTALLPEHVRKIIGVVGEKTVPARRMLEKIGFEWDNSIDPFDGGPTFAVKTDDCAPIINTRRLAYLGPIAQDAAPDGQALVALDTLDKEQPDAEMKPRFQAVYCDYRLAEGGAEINLPDLPGFDALARGAEVGLLPFD
ncbi:arginine N-succinyltransferase [Bradymonas sediminis]|uniref:Arginine N-succinyltransferase n=2 Tax=Bradymonas sediminis TaxID=1548548 RepID=A0A2Z4FR40_9DELT|nr:arginine N-succinyltransferase [Bradymonas sediminis]